MRLPPIAWKSASFYIFPCQCASGGWTGNMVLTKVRQESFYLFVGCELIGRKKAHETINNKEYTRICLSQIFGWQCCFVFSYIDTINVHRRHHAAGVKLWIWRDRVKWGVRDKGCYRYAHKSKSTTKWSPILGERSQPNSCILHK